METKDIRIRCSSLGSVMVGANKGLTTKQSIELIRLEDKETLTANQQETKKSLILKRDAKPSLSVGAKNYIENIFYREFYGYDMRFTNKYTKKGNHVEERSIREVGSYLGYPFACKSEPEYMENDFICTTGYDWKVNEFVFDQKNVWEPKNLNLFSDDKESSVYEWQIKGYAMLLNELKGENIKHGGIIRTLMNPPEEIITQQAKILWVEAGYDWSDKIDQSFIDEVRQQFDFEAKMPDIKDRVRIFKVDVTEDDFKLIRQQVKLCQEYYRFLKVNFGKTNLKEFEFFKNK